MKEVGDNASTVTDPARLPEIGSGQICPLELGAEEYGTSQVSSAYAFPTRKTAKYSDGGLDIGCT